MGQSHRDFPAMQSFPRLVSNFGSKAMFSKYACGCPCSRSASSSSPRFPIGSWVEELIDEAVSTGRRPEVAAIRTRCSATRSRTGSPSSCSFCGRSSASRISSTSAPRLQGKRRPHGGQGRRGPARRRGQAQGDLFSQDRQGLRARKAYEPHGQGPGVTENAGLDITQGPGASYAAKNGAPERIRTSDPQIRSLVLYPAELRARLPGAAGGAT